MAQQYFAVDILEFLTGIGKVFADVAKCGSSQKSVADCVQQDVRVAVSLKPHGMRDLNAADNQFSALGKLVYVNTDSYAHERFNCLKSYGNI